MSTMPSHVDQTPTVPPLENAPVAQRPKRDAYSYARESLGLVLSPCLDDTAGIREIDVASLLLSGLSIHEDDPVIGILEQMVEDSWILHAALNDESCPPTICIKNVIMSLSRRCTIAAELHRRMLSEAQEITRTGEEGGR